VYKKIALMIVNLFSSSSLQDVTHCVKSSISKRSLFVVVCKTKNSGKSNKNPIVHMIPIYIPARDGRGL
jgi:hypothetical protein